MQLQAYVSEQCTYYSRPPRPKLSPDQTKLISMIPYSCPFIRIKIRMKNQYTIPREVPCHAYQRQITIQPNENLAKWQQKWVSLDSVCRCDWRNRQNKLDPFSWREKWFNLKDVHFGTCDKSYSNNRWWPSYYDISSSCTLQILS